MTHTFRCWAIRTAAIIAVGTLSVFPCLAQSGPNETKPSSREAQAAFPHAAVSIDLLRHPISEKGRRMLRTALDEMNSGNLNGAREEMLKLLAKDPHSALYAHSVLGVIYIRTQRYKDAVNSFEIAVSYLPHDAMTHYNLALSSACAKDYERAEQEARRAVELDPENESAQTLLKVLSHRNRIGDSDRDSEPPLAQTEISSGSERHSRN